MSGASYVTEVTNFPFVIHVIIVLFFIIWFLIMGAVSKSNMVVFFLIGLGTGIFAAVLCWVMNWAAAWEARDQANLDAVSELYGVEIVVADDDYSFSPPSSEKFGEGVKSPPLIFKDAEGKLLTAVIGVENNELFLYDAQTLERINPSK